MNNYEYLEKVLNKYIAKHEEQMGHQSGNTVFVAGVRGGGKRLERNLTLANTIAIGVLKAILIKEKPKREPKNHYVKISPKYFDDVVSGKKPFELRFNDRDYQVGDSLMLKEYIIDTCEYTDRMCAKLITYVLEDTKYMQEGYVALGLGDKNGMD